MSGGPRVRRGSSARGPQFRRRRLWRRLVVGVLVLLVALVAVSTRLFVWPAQGMPARVSAIVMLSGPGDRLPEAVTLAREHRAPVLVVSRGNQGYGGPCPAKIPGITLICFDPNPASTQGEAEAIGRLAGRYHWRSVVLVTSRFQDTRARLRVGRCFRGKIYVVTVSQPLVDWPYQIAYEWGALLKALVVQRGC
jgi:uncharacterized SAM-binding protein YcdF (DUF218 family)